MFEQNDRWYRIAKVIHKICWVSLCVIGGACLLVSIILSISLHFPYAIVIGFGALAIFMLLAGLVNVIGNYSFSKHYDLKAIRDCVCNVPNSRFFQKSLPVEEALKVENQHFLTQDRLQKELLRQKLDSGRNEQVKIAEVERNEQAKRAEAERIELAKRAEEQKVKTEQIEKDRREKERLESYLKAVEKMSECKTKAECISLIAKFEMLGSFKDSKQKVKELHEKILNLKKSKN